MFAGALGGPANTTYSENTGVLAVTKVYEPFILAIASLCYWVKSYRKARHHFTSNTTSCNGRR